MPARSAVRICLALLGAGALAGSASAETLWATRDGGSLIQIDTTTRAVTSIGSSFGYGSTWNIEFDVDGTLWATPNFGQYLARVNTTTGVATVVTTLAHQTISTAIDFDGTMYAIGYTDGMLYKVNKSTGAMTPVGSTGIVNSMDAAFDTSGNLWILDFGSRLIRLNKASGAVVQMISLGFDAMSLSIDPTNTAFVIPWSSTDSLYSVNLSTGALTNLGVISGVQYAHGGTFQHSGIGINFTANTWTLTATDSPGVVAGTHWNNVANPATRPTAGSGIALNDHNGNPTTAQLAFAAAGGYAGFPGTSTANAATNTLYKGGLYGDDTVSEVSVTVSNLPYAYYDVYVYSSTGDATATNTISVSNGTTTYYTQSSGTNDSAATSLLQTTSTDASNPTVGAGQYQRFHLMSGSSFTITTGGSINGVIAAKIMGLQIIPVGAPNNPPAITSATSASGTYGTPFSYTIAATNAPTSYNAATLPAGLSVNTTTGVIGGTPTQTGAFNVGLSATNGGGTGTAMLALTIAKASASVALGNLNQVYDGTAKSASATTSPANLAVNFSYTGAALPPVNAGSYGVLAAISDANYTGSASGTLTIAPAAATVTLDNLTQSYDGTPKSVSVTTNPANLSVAITYNGSTTAPTTVGTYAVAAAITDPNYTGSASGSLTIADTTPPVLSLPANITAEATSPNGATVTFNATASDDVDGTVAVTLSPASGSTFPLGTTTVTATAHDAAGNVATGSFTVTVRDTTPPALTAPSNLVLEATSAAGAAANFAATATDAVTASPVIAYSQAPGSTFPLGVTTVTVSATDAAGNKSTGSFTVTVHDTTPPALTVPANQVIEATSAAGATATFSASATDAVTASPAIAYSQASGSTFPLGTTTVNVTATDAAGNQSTGSFTITVRDTTPPALTVPTNLVLEATSAAGAVANFAATATDAVTASPAIAYSQAPGSTFPLGTTSVNVTATDAAGNQSTGSFTVTVRDTTPPTISSVSASPNTIWPPNKKMVPVTISVVAADAVGVASEKIVSVATNEPNGNTQWQITGPLTLNVLADRLGTGTGRIYTITIQVRDAAGNASTKAVTVTVPHDQGK